MNCSSPVPAALMQPQTMTLLPPCLTVGKTHLSLYSSPGCRHTHLTPSEPNKFIFIIRPQDMVPVIHVLSLLVFSKLFAGFLVHHLRRGFLLGRQPCRPIWCSVRRMVWALTGWPPHPFNLWSNAGSTHKSIPQTQPLDITLSTWLKLLCSTMAMPVLSGTCSVKPLYGLGHHAAAQFQGLGNPLIATPSLYRAKIFIRSSESSLPWGAMLNFQWPVWESETDNTRFNTPAPHSHLRPCNTNKSHDTWEKNG